MPFLIAWVFISFIYLMIRLGAIPNKVYYLLFVPRFIILVLQTSMGGGMYSVDIYLFLLLTFLSPIILNIQKSLINTILIISFAVVISATGPYLQLTMIDMNGGVIPQETLILGSIRLLFSGLMILSTKYRYRPAGLKGLMSIASWLIWGVVM